MHRPCFNRGCIRTQTCSAFRGLLTLTFLTACCVTISARSPGKGMQSASRGMEKAVGQDNKGFQMLQRMGWSSGALGRDSQGLAEPINPLEMGQSPRGRSGLGNENGNSRGDFSGYNADFSSNRSPAKTKTHTRKNNAYRDEDPRERLTIHSGVGKMPLTAASARHVRWHPPMGCRNICAQSGTDVRHTLPGACRAWWSRVCCRSCRSKHRGSSCLHGFSR